MTYLVRAELLKLRTLRATWILAGVGIVLSGTIGVFATRLAGSDPLDLRDLVLAPVQPLYLLVVLLAVLAAAAEFQHHTIRTTLLAAPRRGRALTAKSLVTAAAGALLVLVGIATSVLSGTVTAAVSGEPLPAASWGALGAVAGGAALGSVWALFAGALGVLTRSTAAAVTAILVWRFVVEGVVPVVSRRPELGRWMPSGAGDALLGLGGEARLGVGVAAAVLAGYVAVLLSAAATTFLRRDPA